MNILAALLADAPAETTNYMIAGYAVIFSVMAFYLLSLALRSRRLNLDLQNLQELDSEQKNR